MRWIRGLDALRLPTNTSTIVWCDEEMRSMLLVVGATGNVGRGVLEALSKESAPPIRAFVRDPGKLGPQPSHVEVVRGDFSDAASVERAVSGVEAMFLAGALAPNMVERQKSLLAAAKRAGV